MPKPVNYPISPDAPDSENPGLSAKPKVGPPRMKAPKPKAKGITKPDPQDAGVFTQEKLKQFGGTMKDIPQGMDGAMKKGGSVKRYAEGGAMPGRSTGKGGPTAKEMNFKNEEKLKDFYYDSKDRARKLRDDVDKTSSESSRMMQTLSHLAGKTAGDAADNSIRKRENIKESMAEDAEEGARRLGKRVADVRYSDRGYASGGKVSKFAAGGFVRAADGCAQRGKTKGKYI